MSYYIVIREAQPNDTPAISEVVRKAYTSNVFNSWLNALFNEVTFQLIILLSALLFIVFGVPLIFCIVSIPIVLLMIYIVIYGSLLMKSAQVMYEKRPLQSWVAEVYEPLFFEKNPVGCWYNVVTEEQVLRDGIKFDGLQRRIIGTVAVMRFNRREDWAWLFRLAVDKRYRRKGVALKLVQTVQNWCKLNKYNNLELVMTECQEGARELFNKAGFDVRQLYHKKLFTSAFTLQMFQLKCEVRHTFH